MIKSVSVHERRTVGILMQPGTQMTTLKGRSPINVHRIEIIYDLTSGKVWSCIVRGFPLKGTRTFKLIERRVHDDYFRWDWLKSIVEQYRPRVSAR